MQGQKNLRVVLDTTIFVSAFLTTGGLSAELLERCMETTNLFVSVPLLDEVRHTLVARRHLRQRYGYTESEIEEFIQFIRAGSTLISPLIFVSIVRDPNDDKILDCAVAASADYLITRDEDLLTLQEYQTIRILTPEVFIHILRQASNHPGRNV